MDGRKAGVLIGLENRDVGKLAWGFDPLFIRNMGKMVSRLKSAVCKIVAFGYGGSNPSLPTMESRQILVRCTCLLNKPG